MQDYRIERDMVEKLTVKGYKSIRDLDLELKAINIFIGSNGSGKSNLLSFFEFLRNIYDRNLREYVALRGGMDRFLFQGRKITDELSARLDFGHNAYSFTLKPAEEAFLFTEEGLWYDRNPYMANPTDIATLAYESNLRFCDKPRAFYIQTYLDSLEKYHFHDTGATSPLTKVSNVENDTERLYSTGDNIAAFLYNMRQENKIGYNFIVRTIQSIAPYFKDFVLKPDSNGNLTLKWQDKYSSSVYGVSAFSDGTMRFVALAVLFLQSGLPDTIVLDEPELGLHPYAIAKLSGLIKSAASKGCQVIMATQSADLISYFAPEDIITVEQVNGQSVFNRLDSDELSVWLDEYYTVGELWQHNVIGGQP